LITAIDTNILLDILIPDEEFILSSKRLLDKYADKGQLIICEIVYAELASQFPPEKELKNFLSDTTIKLVYSNERSLSLAGERWRAYSKSRGSKLRCPKCGKQISLSCPECRNTILTRQHIISDFIIGAHALTQADLLLSRDRGFYKKCFEDLRTGNLKPSQ
jgi:predicted nucleic acid-binding protein